MKKLLGVLVSGLLLNFCSKESEEKIKQRVRQALEHIDKRRLILAPDCGLGFLPRKLCLQKLKLITKVAKSFIN